MTPNISNMFLPFSDEPNGNHRIYNKYSVDVSSYMDKIKDKTAFGEFIPNVFHEYNDESQLELSRISHIIDSLELTDKGIIGSLTILDTFHGKIIKKLLESELAEFVVRPRLIGYVDFEHVVHASKIISFDIMPSFMDTFNPLNYRNIRFKLKNNNE